MHDMHYWPQKQCRDNMIEHGCPRQPYHTEILQQASRHNSVNACCIVEDHELSVPGRDSDPLSKNTNERAECWSDFVNAYNLMVVRLTRSDFLSRQKPLQAEQRAQGTYQRNLFRYTSVFFASRGL